MNGNNPPNKRTVECHQLRFFEKIFLHCSKAYGTTASQLDGAIVRFDSKIVSMSTKLLNVGYNLKGGDAEKYGRLLKFTVGYRDMPDCICFHKDPGYNSENKALSEAVLSNQKTVGQISVFDRGSLHAIITISWQSLKSLKRSLHKNWRTTSYTTSLFFARVTPLWLKNSLFQFFLKSSEQLWSADEPE